MFRAVSAFEHPARSSTHGFRSHRRLRLLLALREFCGLGSTTYILSFKPIAQLQFDNNADEQRQMSYLIEFVIDQDGFWRIKDM
jgi:hypothetical protein